MGDKEAEAGTVAVRTRYGEDLGVLSIEDFVSHLERDVARRGRIDVDS